ncbi:MAG TPA: hypothetical protein P5556_08120 [Candidatus Gastranaerophilales bacterium]|nr:hypothetical protein [Candidatus Gastranaerophilales bacterium]
MTISFRNINPYTPTQNDVFHNFHQRKNSFSEGHKPSSDSKDKKDPFLCYPGRALAYTDEIGEALRPAIGNVAATLFWAPALLYFGADVWDKYKKGTDDSYQNPDAKTGARQAIFHLIASIAGPVAAVHGAQEASMRLGGEKFINNTLKKIEEPGSKLASKIEKTPLIGKKLLDMLKNNATNKEFLTSRFKTGVGLAALVFVALPIDIFTEKLFIKKVVNPALGLKSHDDRK